MPRFHRRVAELTQNAWFWLLDYAYVVRVEALSLVRRRPPASYLEGDTTLPAIILIPGIYESWYFMKPIGDVLSRVGYSVHIIDGLGYNRGSVDAMASVVAEYVKQHALTDCVIVAHSKGGLIGKYLLIHHNQNDAIKQLVTLNTPFSGSVYARLVPFRRVRIFKPDSKVLTLLAADSKANRKITSIYGRFDPHIPGGSPLEGAHNVRLSTSGHFQIMTDPRVHRAVLQAIQK